MLLQEADRRCPVRLLRRRIGQPLRVARGERGDIPREGQQKRDGRERHRPPPAQRERQDRERNGGEAESGDVLAEA